MTLVERTYLNFIHGKIMSCNVKAAITGVYRSEKKGKRARGF
jgi:hypothetical protein